MNSDSARPTVSDGTSLFDQLGGAAPLRLAVDRFYEAVLAAGYLDAGFDAARRIVMRLWAGRLDSLEDDPRDAKTALQEWAQANGMPPPAYIQTERSGPDHAPIFLITARLADGREAQAQGAGTKRSIEQAAAQTLLDRLEGRA